MTIDAELQDIAIVLYVKTTKMALMPMEIVAVLEMAKQLAVYMITHDHYPPHLKPEGAR